MPAVLEMAPRREAFWDAADALLVRRRGEEFVGNEAFDGSRQKAGLRDPSNAQHRLHFNRWLSFHVDAVRVTWLLKGTPPEKRIPIGYTIPFSKNQRKNPRAILNLGTSIHLKIARKARSFLPFNVLDDFPATWAGKIFLSF